jgi:3-deoxy-D-arabino-heptulosonate 7-phosphate (DAHP) synthase
MEIIFEYVIDEQSMFNVVEMLDNYELYSSLMVDFGDEEPKEEYRQQAVAFNILKTWAQFKRTYPE